MKKVILLLSISFLALSNATYGQISFSDSKLIDSTSSFNIEAHSACLIDIDNDGDKDLLCADNWANNKISWYEHDENHHLYIKHNNLFQNTIIFITIAVDLDQDGLEDLLFLQSKNSPKFSWVWYKNLGNAQFANSRLVVAPTAQYDPQSYDNKVIDYDGDGDLDFVYLPNYAIDNNKNIDWVANDGNGNFSAPQHLYSSPLRIGGYELEDLDGDSKRDLVFTEIQANSYGQLRLYVAKNNGNGQFQNKIFIKDSVDYNVDVFDMDQDNKPDIVTEGHYGNSQGSIDWIKNNGSGSFSVSHDLPGVWNNTDYRIADLDNDGDMDIITQFNLTSIDFAYRIFQNTGAGVFSNPKEFIMNDYYYLQHIYISDWDADGTNDIIFNSYNNLALYKTDDTATFVIRRLITQDGTFGMYEPKIGDLDGDGKNDIFGGYGKIAAWYHQGSNETFDGKEYIISDTTFSHSNLADLDHDNDLDLVWFSGNTIYWFANDGTGHYGPKTIIKNISNVDALKIKDLNGDGAPEIIYRYYNTFPLSSGLVVLKNNGDATFSTAQTVNAGTSQITQSDLADLDGDGDQDLYYSNKLKELVWLKNDGTGQFSDKQSITTLPFPNITVLATDMDTDGDLDIFYCNGLLPYAFYIHKNDGFGVFAGPSVQDLDFPIFLLTAPHAADLDHDGDNDIVFGGENCIFRLENTGQGVLNAPEYVVQTNEIPYWNVELEDLNNDGQIDILGAASDLTKIAWFENQSVVATHNANLIDNNLSLSPNPAISESSLAIASYNIHNQYLIELQDLSGKTLNTYNTNDSNFILQRNNLPAGAYFLRVSEAKSGKLLGVEQLIWN